MKRMIALVLAMTLLLSLAGCGSAEPESAPTEATEEIIAAETTEETTLPPDPFDFGDVHYSLHMPVYEVVSCTMESGGELLAEFKYTDFVYNEKGQLTSKTETEWEYDYEYEYDDQGRVSVEIQKDEYSTNVHHYTYYDIDYPVYQFADGTWEKNGSGLVKSLFRESDLEFYDNYRVEYKYEFDEQGRVIKETSVVRSDYYRNEYNYTYNDMGQICRVYSETFYDGDWQTKADNWSDYTMTYDVAGNLIREEGTSFYSWDDYPEKDLITYEYGVTDHREISTETNPELLTTDNWESFAECFELPVPSSCIDTIEVLMQETKDNCILYSYTLPNDSNAYYEAYSQYRTILSQICGFTLQEQENMTALYKGGSQVGYMDCGYDAQYGYFLMIGFPLT